MAAPLSFGEYLRLHEVTLAGGQTIDPKKFEKDLVRALNGITGYSHYQSRSAEILAHKVATAARSLGLHGTAQLLSGSSPMSNLSPIYREYGVRSGEPKADIHIGDARCSMKYAKYAQVATAQANETRAVFAATFASSPEYRRLVTEQLLPLIKETMSVATFQKLRAQYSQTHPTAFQNMLSKVLGFHSQQGNATAAERTEFQKFLAITGVHLPIRDELYRFLDSRSTKQSVFLEFVSGRHRFVRPELSATHLLVWDEQGRVACTPVEQYVAANLSRFSYSIRGAHTSAALRIDIQEAVAHDHDLLAVIEECAIRVQQDILRESVLQDMWSGITDIGQQFAAAAKAVILFLMHLLHQGIVAALEFFGYEVPSLEWSI